jgi:hypothetical protein
MICLRFSAARAPAQLGALLSLAALVACGDDDAAPDAGASADAGVLADAGGAVDSGAPMDAGGAPDAGGEEDAGASRDAGYYCTTDGQEQVEGRPVPVPDAPMPPQASGSARVSLRCIDREVRPFDTRVPVCFTKCLDFFGFEPTAAQVQELEVDVFAVANPDGGVVDPSFDFATRMERSPNRRLGVGYVTRMTPTAQCESGYQIEIGYLNLGMEAMSSGVEYVLRVRSRAAANPTWVTLYVWDFIRRLDEANQVGSQCSADEMRIPERATTFPALAASTLQTAIQSATASIAGSDDLFDGQGDGYALVETRDCATTGSRLENLTAGFAPAPDAAGYVDAMDGFDADASATSPRGLAFALGLSAVDTATRAASTVRAAVGVQRDPGACTEAFGGVAFPVFPDSVTFVRTNRETTIQPVF